MATINIKHNYTMPTADLKSQLDGLTDKMADRYDLKCQWKTDNCLTFSRSGASGEILIDKNQVNFSMKLGLMLSAFKSKIERDVKKFMDDNVS